MKHLLRVPTVEYGFIEEEFEGTAEEAYEAYTSLIGICRAGIGLPEPEWRKALDKYLAGDGTDSETYYRMNQAQQSMIQELKKAFKRITYNKD